MTVFMFIVISFMRSFHSRPIEFYCFTSGADPGICVMGALAPPCPFSLTSPSVLLPSFPFPSHPIPFPSLPSPPLRSRPPVFCG